MQQLNAEYVIGLVDGEGSFTIYVRNPLNPKIVQRRVVVEPKFYIKLVERDREILERVKKFFGCGSIYFQKDTRKNHQHCARYEVYNRKDILEIIIPFFKEHTLQFPSKRKDFEIFCSMMKMIEKGVHLKGGGVEQLLLLKQQMH